jgi:hypothetical protein
MKLYREEMKKFQYIAEPIEYKCPCCGIHILGEEDYCPGCEVKLKYPHPEITEEEIEAIFHSEYATPKDPTYTIEYDAYMAGYKAALSKLKGE